MQGADELRPGRNGTRNFLDDRRSAVRIDLTQTKTTTP
jgi:hypothetical protein